MSFRIPRYRVNVFVVRSAPDIDEIERGRVFRIRRSFFVFSEYPDGVIGGGRDQKSGQVTPRDAVYGAIVRAGNGANALPRFGVLRADGRRVQFESFIRFIILGGGAKLAPNFEALVVADAG